MSVRLRALQIAGTTPLIAVAIEGRFQMAEILLQAGADWTARNNPPSGMKATAREWAQYHANQGSPFHGRVVALIDDQEKKIAGDQGSNDAMDQGAPKKRTGKKRKKKRSRTEKRATKDEV